MGTIHCIFTQTAELALDGAGELSTRFHKYKACIFGSDHAKGLKWWGNYHKKRQFQASDGRSWWQKALFKPQWSESIAVVSKSFVERIKEKLRIRAIGRNVVQKEAGSRTQGTYDSLQVQF